MKIYTKRGDKGYTSLFGGSKVEKDNLRIHAYGTVDELNSILGVCLTYPVSKNGHKVLTEIQKQLFVLGSDLATPLSKKTKVQRIGIDAIEQLESWIDSIDNLLPPLTSFILPGGSKAGASLHHARTVCRRAERHTVNLKWNEPVSEETIIYLNRLSDLLFVLARFENREAGIDEIKWIPGE